MTTYVVLKQVTGTIDVEVGWIEVDRVDARDDKHAIQQATTEAGTFVAVPVRSWTPRTRQVETVQKDVWS